LDNPHSAAASIEPSEQADQTEPTEPTEPTESTSEFGEKTERAEPNAYVEGRMVSSPNGCEN
jgi:hypothetical protein